MSSSVILQPPPYNFPVMFYFEEATVRKEECIKIAAWFPNFALDEVECLLLPNDATLPGIDFNGLLPTISVFIFEISVSIR